MGRIGRTACIAGGSLCVALALAGVFLPVLPTTPFLLVAAALYGRSSPRLRARLLHSRWLGRYLRDFLTERAIPLRAKILSVALLWGAMLGCILGPLAGRDCIGGLLVVVAAAVTGHILSYDTLRRDREA